MKQNPHLIRVLGVAVALAIGIPAWQSFAADAAKGEKDDPITEVMKKYHKAPKGTDPVCKRAIEGKATKEELQGPGRRLQGHLRLQTPEGRHRCLGQEGHPADLDLRSPSEGRA